jgi:outer membrane protein OmpA-like peptidoglycan-associated protein
LLPANPTRVTAVFVRDSSVLSAGDKAALRALARKLLPGASVTITGYAMGNAALAKRRATVVANYLKQQVQIRVTLKTVVTSRVNQSSVTTTRQ